MNELHLESQSIRHMPHCRSGQALLHQAWDLLHPMELPQMVRSIFVAPQAGPARTGAVGGMGVHIVFYSKVLPS